MLNFSAIAFGSSKISIMASTSCSGKLWHKFLRYIFPILLNSCQCNFNFNHFIGVLENFSEANSRFTLNSKESVIFIDILLDIVSLFANSILLISGLYYSRQISCVKDSCRFAQFLQIQQSSY